MDYFKGENMTKQFIDYGIDLPMDASGQCYTVCPKCSSSRKKSTKKCLGVDTDRQIWNCSHCGWSGSLKSKDIIMEKTQKSIQWTAGKKLPSKVIEWFKKRGISEATLSKFDIQYREKCFFPQIEKSVEAICFPYKEKGKIVDIKYRSFEKEFKTEKGAKKIFFGLDNITEADKIIIIVEGEIDVLSCYEAGLTNCISVPNGAPAVGSMNFNTKFQYLENNQDLVEKWLK